METSPLICYANQWTSFRMIRTSVMKELRVALSYNENHHMFNCSKCQFQVCEQSMYIGANILIKLIQLVVIFSYLY